MSGDSHRDDPDFLDDDFVIEDLAGKNDDLDQLFTTPAGKPAARDANAPPDEDDVLFTDHTEGLQPSEQFQGRAQFAEDGASTWSGENLELDEVGVPDGEPAAADDEELALDSDNELELIGGASATGDADSADEEAHEPIAAAAEAPEPLGIGDEVEAEAAAIDEPQLIADEAPVEPGWEPLPESSVDDLAEVGDVDRVDEYAANADEHDLVAAGVQGESLESVDGHDIYAEESPANEVVAPPRRRAWGLLTAMAASLALVGGAAVVVMRPQWVGLSLEPERLQQVRIDRPSVQVVVATPPVPQPPAAPVDPTPPPVDPTPPPMDPTPPPVDVQPPPVDPAPPPVDVQPVPPVDPTPPPADPEPVVPAPSPATPWPVVAADPNTASNPGGTNPLMRVGENLMLGDLVGEAAPARIVDGVLPGSRAFAQLHNGNYFIGSVKLADPERVTLRVNDGEVTLRTTDLMRLTELGSADYVELQRATSGFVRLTNNNRLVGGILSQIADDHIVLEFRSNRVMLPRSVVGEVVRGDSDSAVRLDTTREEDAWLRLLAERQIGTGQGPQGTPPPAPPRDGR